MEKIRPCLWFDHDGEEAARFYVSLLPDSRIDRVVHAAMPYPNGAEGDVLVVEFTLAGRGYMALNGGPNFHFDEAVSLQIETADQAETDRLWDALIADGGSPSVCGWCKDRFGLSWQVTPRRLTELIADPDRTRAARAMQAMMGMGKIDIAALDAAVDGAAA